MAMAEQEINEAVARKLGWTDLFLSKNIGVIDIAGKRNPNDTMNSTVPDYCHSIEAAWDIVDHVSKAHAIHIGTGFRGEPWNATTWSCDIADHPGNKDHWVISKSATTAPMAICLAYLKLNA